MSSLSKCKILTGLEVLLVAGIGWQDDYVMSRLCQASSSSCDSHQAKGHCSDDAEIREASVIWSNTHGSTTGCWPTTIALTEWSINLTNPSFTFPNLCEIASGFLLDFGTYSMLSCSAKSLGWCLLCTCSTGTRRTSTKLFNLTYALQSYWSTIHVSIRILLPCPILY